MCRHEETKAKGPVRLDNINVAPSKVSLHGFPVHPRPSRIDRFAVFRVSLDRRQRFGTTKGGGEGVRLRGRKVPPRSADLGYGGSLRFLRPHFAMRAIKGMSFDPSGVRLYSTLRTKLAYAVRSTKPQFTSAFSSRPNTLSAIVVMPAALTARFNSPYRRGLFLSSQAIRNLCLPFVSL